MIEFVNERELTGKKPTPSEGETPQVVGEIVEAINKIAEIGEVLDDGN